MPMGTASIDLSTTGEKQIVQRGVRITALTLTDLPAGLSVRFRFGGNPPTSRISTTGPFPSLDRAPASDVCEGVWLVNDVASPGSTAELFYSVSPAGGFDESGGGGGGIAGPSR
jgi:hypothetical protein